MTLIDTFNHLTGATKKAKGGLISQLGRDIGLVEEYMTKEIPDEWHKNNVPADLVEDMNKGTAIILRLVNKLELSYTDEVANDTILVAKASLLLDTVLMLDFGWRLNSSSEGEVSLSYPEFYKILQTSKDELMSHAQEARNTIAHLYEKYPY